MHVTPTGASIVAAFALAAATAAPPARAQGALKPVEALIVNPTNRPVPVSVVPAPIAPTAQCRVDVSTAGSLLPVPSIGRTMQIVQLECSEGVTRLDVHRVVFSTGTISSQPSPYQVHYTVSLGLGRQTSITSVDLEMPIATLSNGTPDLALARPVRVDKTAAGVYLMLGISCSSGLAGVQPQCGGTVFLIGTPVN
jgi:hypothetical protein